MPKCRNDPNARYTGKERSPLGLGWCAHTEAVGKRRKGTDGTMYQVAKRKSGVRYWQTSVAAKAEKLHKGKVHTVKRKKETGAKPRKRWEDSLKTSEANTRQTIFEECSITTDAQWRSFSKKLIRLRILRGDVTSKLLEVGIHLILVRNPQDTNGNYNVEYPWKIANNTLPRARNHHVIVAPLQVDSTGIKPQSTNLFCQFENIDGKYKEAAVKILTSAFGERFQWNGQETSSMIIRLK
jgi:hypothetical protein